MSGTQSKTLDAKSLMPSLTVDDLERSIGFLNGEKK